MPVEGMLTREGFWQEVTTHVGLSLVEFSLVELRTWGGYREKQKDTRLKDEKLASAICRSSRKENILWIVPILALTLVISFCISNPP